MSVLQVVTPGGSERGSSPRLEHMRIAVSYYCSLRCQHCYVPELNRTKYKKLLEHSQLSLDEINAFVDLLVDAYGLSKISITGGEAMLRVVWPRTAAVLRHALDAGLTVQLNTSGSGQIDMDEVARVCGDELDQLTLQLSLDGIDEEKVDVFRGRKGAMRRAIKTLDDAVGLEVSVQTRYTMTEANCSDTVACYDFVTDHGAHSFHVKPMFAAGTARDNAGLLMRSEDAVRAIQWDLLERSVGSRTHLGLPEPVYVPEREFPPGAEAYVIKCACGGGAGYLSTNGDVYPCTYLVGAPDEKAWVLGNIRDPGFDFVRAWSAPSTYGEFRNAVRDRNCTAQNVVSEGIEAPVGPVQGQCG